MEFANDEIASACMRKSPACMQAMQGMAMVSMAMDKMVLVPDTCTRVHSGATGGCRLLIFNSLDLGIGNGSSKWQVQRRCSNAGLP